MDAWRIEQVGYDFPAAEQMISRLQDYYRTLYQGPDGAPVDPREFSPPQGAFFVGFDDERPVAMGGWRVVEPMSSLGCTHPVEIKRMYVEPAARGRGYARRVLAHLERTAAATGADAIVLSTGSPQVDAIGLYRANGYQPIEKFGYYARYPSAVHLGKRLTPHSPADLTRAPASDGR
jgi:GNAT superfamily N-acetyltransferase